MQESKDELRPNFFQCPNALVDKYMAELSGSDLKCYLTIIRQTTGWHKKSDRISISQFVKFTGLSNRAVIDSCRSLMVCGLIVQAKDEHQNNVYILASGENFSPHEKSSHHEKSSQGVVKKVHGGSEKSSQVASEKSSHTKDSSLNTLSKDTKQNTLGAKREKTTLNADDLILLGVDKQIANDWLSVRKAKRAPLTKTAFDAMQREADKANITLAESVAVCAENGWQGFKCEWYQKLNNKPNSQTAKPFEKSVTPENAASANDFVSTKKEAISEQEKARRRAFLDAQRQQKGQTT